MRLKITIALAVAIGSLGIGAALSSHSEPATLTDVDSKSPESLTPVH